MDRRVVVTGTGMITAVGLSVQETWEGLLNGRSGVRLIDAFSTDGFPTRIAAQVTGFDALDYLRRKEARRAGRFTQFAVATASEALGQSGLDLQAEDRTRVGLQIGSAVGGLPVIEDQTVVLRQDGPRRINPVLVPTVIVSAAPCFVAVQWNIQGPTSAPAAACATGIVAVGDAMHWLRRGDVDVVLAGGTESAVTPLALASFSRLGALSTRNEEPERACRPFDIARDGTVLGEGAAMLVLETADHALHRGASILAEVVGYGLAEDGYHMTAPDPSGNGALRAMGHALKDAGLRPSEIDYIVAHGTGTPLNDVSETKAIRDLFGERARQLAISSNKAGIGHTLGAAGAISTVVGIKAMLEGVLPPTANLETPDPACDLDYIPLRPRAAHVDTAMINAIGFGGQNASVIVRRWRG